MIDLRSTSGLPLHLDDAAPDWPVQLAGGLSPGTLDVRQLADLRRALADPAASGPDPAYYMHRGVARFSAAAGRAYRWRYDLTVFPPGRYGEEYLRTVGHYHPPVRPGGPAYPEVYEVLAGEALFLLQRVDDYLAGPGSARVLDFTALRARAGDKAMMLPDYGHWTVNTTDAPLVVSNWICDDFVSHYDSAERARGAACHVVAGPEGPAFRANHSYAHPPAALRHARPRGVPALGLVAGQPILTALLTAPERWRYLCDPDEAEVGLWSAVEIISTDPFPGPAEGHEA